MLNGKELNLSFDKEENFNENKLKKIWNKIYDFLYGNLIYPPKLFIRRVIKVFQWIPVIWKTWDFDYSSSLDVFKYQLERTADFLESNKTFTVNAKYHAQQIRTALRLMKKVYDEEYGMEYINIIEKKYGKSNFKFIPCEYDEKGKPTLFEMKIVWERNYTEDEIDEIEKEKNELFLISREKEERAHKLLWKYFEKNIRSWWD